MVFLDLAKAYDPVPHKKLLDRLEIIGIRCKALRVFANYLKDRVQFVKIGGFTATLYQKIEATKVFNWLLYSYDK